MRKFILLVAVILLSNQSLFSQVPSYVPTNGLVGFWPFSGNANDASTNGNNGTVNGATLTTDRNGVANSAYSFNGSSSYISVPNNATFNFQNKFTFSYWINPTSLSGSQLSVILSKQISFGADQNGFNSNIELGSCSNFRVQNGTSNPSFSLSSPNNSILINNWYHVVQVWNGTHGTIYINGILISQGTITATVGNNTADLLIGKPNWTAANVKVFNGKIDDIGIWNRALTTQEISSIYYQTTSTTCLPDYVPTNGLVGYWPFCGNANDASGNGNNGTVNGATLIADRNGVANSAYNFVGENYIDCGTSNSLGLISSNIMTINYWTKSNSSNFPYIQKYQDLNAPNSNYFVGSSDTSIPNKIRVTANGQNSKDYNIILNQWINITVIYNGLTGTSSFYLNGQFVSTDNLIFSNLVSNQSLIFGKKPTILYPTPNGTLDDIGIWNRALTTQEIDDLYTSCTPPAAPTGSLTQTFCATPAPTVASLTATGTGIQWYAAATGGTALATTTALVNATTYYATQTLNACESTTRLAVTVTLNDPQITASATTVCSGTPLTININDVNTPRFNIIDFSNKFNYNPSTLPLGSTDFLSMPTGNILFNNIPYSISSWNNTFNSWNAHYDTGNNPRILELNFTSQIVNDLNLLANTFWGQFGPNSYVTIEFYNNSNLVHTKNLIGDIDIRDYNNSIHPNNINNTTTTNVFNFGNSRLDNIKIQLPTSQIINKVVVKDFGSTAFQRIFIVAATLSINANQTSYLWSTGATTATINPSPMATTTYWCDVTVNGVTCRKTVTITVNSIPAAPTGTATQTFCVTPAPTVASLTATGTGIQWYAAATGGTPLATTTALVSGTTYYATQTLNACESVTRLAVTVTLNDPQITASATTVCSGTPVTLSASTTATVAQNCNLPANLQTGLVGYWPFCGNANDVSGNANNGTVNGATLTTDRFGNANSAYSFNGVSNYINLTNSLPDLTNFTLSGWFYHTKGSSYSGIFSDATQDGGNDLYFNMNSTSIGLKADKSGSLLNRSPLPEVGVNSNPLISNLILGNSWKFITITINQNETKVYLDGNYLQTINQGGSNVGYHAISPSIGRISDQGYAIQYFQGKLDDFAIHNRALSPTEITQLYTAAPTYLWSTGETTATINPSPTATTTYWCDVTVNGVTCRKTMTITVNPNITPAFTQVTAICSGATLAALPTTSTNIITGTWSPALNNTATTTYTFTPTAGQCATTATMSITVNPNITPAFTQVAAICNGATLAALPTTSTNSITGTWSPALNNTATTTYTFTPTAGQCATTATMAITVNTTPAPTGTLTQTFCASPAPTVASLTATGTGVQWYATATGGTALATTTTLANGTTYYATQTLNACESTTRLAVTVTLNDPQITASATTVCSGTPVTLSASTTATVAQNCNLPANLQTGLVGYWPFCGNANDVSGNANNGTVNGATLAADRFGNANSAYNFDGVGNYIIVPSNNVFNSNDISVSMWVSSTKLQRQIALIRLTYANASNEHFGIAFNDLNPYGVELAAKYNTLNCLAGQGWQKNEKIQNILDNNFHHVLGTISGNTLKIYIDGNLSQTLVTPYLQTSNCWNGDIQIGRNWSSLTDFFSGKIDDIGIWNRTLSPSEAQQLYTAAPTYLWSTGDTTATINPSPTATTTYWCDVTVNGLTCRKSVTINVNSTPTPTGTATQTFCATPAPTVASLTATGTGIQWYAAATGGTPLATTTALVSGTTYYATQTLNACESTTRLAVIVTLNDPQITASASTVCSGTPVTLSASTTATVTQNCNLPSNLTNGLVGYWPFCGNANDVSGNANNGTVNGATLAADRFGNANSAYSFDGVDDFIESSNFCYNNGDLDQTVSVWFNPTSNTSTIGPGQTFFNTAPHNGFGFGYSYIGNQSIYIFKNSDPGVSAWNIASNITFNTPTINLNSWHHALVVKQGLEYKFYYNGNLVGNLVSTINPIQYLCKIRFGAITCCQPEVFNGKLDDISLFNRALSPTEITQLYNSNQATYLWSTGATTATINPSPTATTTYWCDVTVNGVTCRKSITITVNPNTTPTFTQVAPICNGATVAALPTTSNEGITGTWSPALNNTTTTIYTFAPTAGQCATTATMTITVNPNSTPTFTQVAPICNGATVAALPTTSTNSFTGTWSPALNNTATTTYTFTPTAGQCATTATMTITVNPNSTPTFTQVAPICNGATLAALPTTSSNTITGTWSPALNNTATTTYTFTPTAGLCATTATMTITVNPLPIAPTGTITQTFCANIYPTLQNIVVTPSNINWYTSLTSTSPLPLTTNLPVGSTTYYASQFDAVTGCMSNGRLAVVATVLLEITPTTLTDQTFCSTDIKTLADVKTNGLNIVWYSSSSGGTPLLDSYLLTSSQSLYAAIYNTASGCESPIRQMVQITIINCQLVPNNLLTLNDNSLNDNLTIENIENFPINQIEIYNRFGELVWKTEYYNNDSNTFKGRANVSGVFQKDSDLPTGTYYFILKYYDSYRGKYTDLKSFLYINNNN